MILSKVILVYTAMVTRPNQAEVYFIRDTISKTVKIGKTGHNGAPQRLKQLQTGNPNELVLVKTIPTSSHKEAFKLERTLHEDNKALHHRGEWYVESPELKGI